MTRSALLALIGLLAVVYVPVVYAQTWNYTEGQQVVRFAWASYCPTSQIASWTCYWCRDPQTPQVNVVSMVSDWLTGTSGFIGYYHDTILVMFRGSENIQNWLENIKFFKEPLFPNLPNVRVHIGFNNGWQALRNATRNAITTTARKCPTCNRILFAGHSLGGAIATLAAVDSAYTRLSKLPMQSITLGSPRVGDEAFDAFALQNVPNTIRWTNQADPIPHAPPRKIPVVGTDTHYRHRTREVWQKTDTTYKTCSATDGEDPTCSDSVNGIAITFGARYHSNYGNVDSKSGPCYGFKWGPNSEELIQATIVGDVRTSSGPY